MRAAATSSIAGLWSSAVSSPRRCCVSKPVPQATSSVRAGGMRGEQRLQRVQLVVPVRPVEPVEAAEAEVPLVVLPGARVVVRLHAPRVRTVLESVPNFSEGRDQDVIEALRRSLSWPARLLDVHVDADHHRSVFTLVGEEEPLVETLLAGIARARDLIDLRRHEGAHPRVGAADVVPIVPIRREAMGRARETATVLARRIGEELGLPVFLYGELAPARGPAFFRRGGPSELQRRIDSGELAPDFGPRVLDPAAGGGVGRGAAPADRVQREFARQSARRRRRSRRSSARRAAASPACGRSGSTCRAPASSRSR